MADTAEQTNSGIDNVKLGLAAVIIAAGFYGFYYFAEQPLLYRVLGILCYLSLLLVE